MGDSPRHKTMLTQLTDLDDHELDEQAGLFLRNDTGHTMAAGTAGSSDTTVTQLGPGKDSLAHPETGDLGTSGTIPPQGRTVQATPFFQPSQVFPDMMDVASMVDRNAALHPRHSSSHRLSRLSSYGWNLPTSSMNLYYTHGGGLATPSLPHSPAAVGSHTGDSQFTRFSGDPKTVESRLLPADTETSTTVGGFDVPGESLSTVGGFPHETSGRPESVLRRNPSANSMPPNESNRHLRVEAAEAKGGPRPPLKRKPRKSRYTDEGDQEQFIYRYTRPRPFSVAHDMPSDSHLAEDRVPRSSGALEQRWSIMGSGTSDAWRNVAAAHNNQYTGGGNGPSYPAGEYDDAVPSEFGSPSLASGEGPPLRKDRRVMSTSYSESPTPAHRSLAPSRALTSVDGLVPRGRNRRSKYFNPSIYGSIDDLAETVPLFRRHRYPSDAAPTSPRNLCWQVSYTLAVGIMLLLAFGTAVLLFNLSSTPLTDVGIIGVTNVLAAEKQLMFDMHVTGSNGNVRDIEMEAIDLSIFATPVPVKNHTQPDPTQPDEPPVGNLTQFTVVNPALFLGTVTDLTDPILFSSGSFWGPHTSIVTTQLRLKSPGASDNDDKDQSMVNLLAVSIPSSTTHSTTLLPSSTSSSPPPSNPEPTSTPTPTPTPTPSPPHTPDESDAERWARIILKPYDLTVRGTLRYSLWFKPHVIRLCFIQRVDPTLDADSMTVEALRERSRKYLFTASECDKEDHPS
ncbi:Vacuolar inheritance and morphology protein [Dispira parvispora]|uniref:Vacuolar inheritance and morphology protein n=1 Tax=Dispira parvispora TaxID=1520584 RepID=A0A9W8AHY8_9FUNG|nr:Vacuolar inheritance and morphology protein [Dispira parvispora]